jgi:MFS family permease
MFTVCVFLFSQFDIEIFQPLRWALFTVIAAFSYGWSYDLYEVTMTSYILKRSSKEQFAQNISQKKVSEAIGMLGGLIVGGITLSFGSQVAQVFLLFFLFGLFLFVKHHFDRDEDEVQLKFSEGSLVNWREVFNMIAHPDTVATVMTEANASLKDEVLRLSRATAQSLKDLPEDAQKKAEVALDAARKKLIDILMEEQQIQKEGKEKPKFEFSKMMEEVSVLFKDFSHIFSRHTPFVIFWVMAVVMFFSFWDTMAITFQPLFLARFANQLGPFGKALGGVIMGIFIIPVFALQIPFAKMADKHGRHLMVLIGISLSGISLLLLGFIDILFGGSITILLLAGMLNSTGYAAAFSPAQAMFVAEHQKYIFQQTGKQVDNEAGAAPLRLTLNIGNIFGQMIGGFIFAFMGFTTGFMLFGIVLITMSLFTLPFFKKFR